MYRIRVRVHKIEARLMNFVDFLRKIRGFDMSVIPPAP